MCHFFLPPESITTVLPFPIAQVSSGDAGCLSDMTNLHVKTCSTQVGSRWFLISPHWPWFPQRPPKEHAQPWVLKCVPEPLFPVRWVHVARAWEKLVKMVLTPFLLFHQLGPRKLSPASRSQSGRDSFGGFEQNFYRDHLRPSENIDIYIVNQNSSKITIIMPQQMRNCIS